MLGFVFVFHFVRQYGLLDFISLCHVYLDFLVRPFQNLEASCTAIGRRHAYEPVRSGTGNDVALLPGPEVAMNAPWPAMRIHLTAEVKRRRTRRQIGSAELGYWRPVQSRSAWVSPTQQYTGRYRECVWSSSLVRLETAIRAILFGWGAAGCWNEVWTVCM